mgnify:CR=1 FL=1
MSPDGAKIFTTDTKQLRVWDVATRKDRSAEVAAGAADRAAGRARWPRK